MAKMGDLDPILSPPLGDVVRGPRPILYDAYDRPLVRRIGFSTEGTAMQTRGTNPGLYDGAKKTVVGKAPMVRAPKIASRPSKGGSHRGGRCM